MDRIRLPLTDIERFGDGAHIADRKNFKEVTSFIAKHLPFLRNPEVIFLDGSEVELQFKTPSESRNPDSVGVSGVDDPELLRIKEPASVLYLLFAIEQFSRMSTDEIRSLGFEVALMGENGLNFSESERKYRLKSLPGEKFSGLALMCLLFASFQHFAPEMNLQLDLDDAYKFAMQLHEGKQNVTD